MSRAMTETQIVATLAERTGLSKQQVRLLFRALAELAYKEARRGFVIPGLGKLVVVHRGIRLGRNPATGEMIRIPAKRVVKFRIPKAVGDAIRMAGPGLPVAGMGGGFRSPGAGGWTPMSSAGEVLISRQTAKAVPKKKPDKREYATVRVYYGTTRAPTGFAMEGKFYGFKRAYRVRRGVCTVSVPVTHKAGRVERPSIFRLEFREDPRRHMVLLSLSELGPKEFMKRLNKHLDRCGDRQAFVFVHGFKTTFQEAVLRAAQIAEDLKFAGAPIVFSWPTRGLPTLFGYRHDETNATETTKYFREFLEEIALKTGATRIHLIAHSMGNRIVSDALSMLVAKGIPGQAVTFSQIVLASPDIDADTFKNTIAPAIRGFAKRVTLYAAANDLALRLSRKLHGNYPRAGYIIEKITLADGIDSIDATRVNTKFLGHAAYAESRPVLDDLFYLLTHGHPPAQRALRPVPTSGEPKYFRFAG